MNSTLIPATVRCFIEAVLTTDSDIDSFCLDYYQQTKRRFSNGMDRVAKLNILLEREAHGGIVDKLLDDNLFRDKAQKHRHLLRYQKWPITSALKRMGGAINFLFTGKTPTPTTSSLRKLLELVLRDDSDVNMFCLDYFPAIKRQFANNMDRISKLNLLLDCNHQDILAALYEDDNFGDLTRQNENILRYRLISTRLLGLFLLISIMAGIIFGLRQCHGRNSVLASGNDSIPHIPRYSGPSRTIAKINNAKLAATHVVLHSACSQLMEHWPEYFHGNTDHHDQNYLPDVYRSIQSSLAYGYEDVYDLAGRLAGLRSYLKKRPYPGGIEASITLNPEIINWIEEFALNNPPDQLSKCMQQVYNKRLKNIVRLHHAMYIIHLRLGTLRGTPQELTAKRQDKICSRNEFSEYKRVRPLEWEWRLFGKRVGEWGVKGNLYNPSYICEFWLRRHAEGTAPLVAKLMLNFLLQYDHDYFLKYKNEYPSEILEGLPESA